MIMATSSGQILANECLGQSTEINELVYLEQEQLIDLRCGSKDMMDAFMEELKKSNAKSDIQGGIFWLEKTQACSDMKDKTERILVKDHQVKKKDEEWDSFCKAKSKK